MKIRLLLVLCLLLTLSFAASAAPLDLQLQPNTEVNVVAQMLGDHLGINFLYDEQIANKRITFQVNQPIPEEALMPLFESALRMKGLALINMEQPGWKKIVNRTSFS